MSPILIAGTAIVHVALLCYTVWIIIEQRSHRIGSRALGFLTAGVFFDIVATTCMVLGSSRGLTLHAVLGFSSLTGMLLDALFAWRHWLRSGASGVPRWLHLFSRFAYAWWVIAYFTGAALVMSARH